MASAERSPPPRFNHYSESAPFLHSYSQRNHAFLNRRLLAGGPGGGDATTQAAADDSDSDIGTVQDLDVVLEGQCCNASRKL